ncbi:MAG TPA: nuclear transport factor 2 family protein [Pseudolysinimonas sp.]|nr:nuclear transport factor 2 family protein [Pseudolysinimonas sp.]
MDARQVIKQLCAGWINKDNNAIAELFGESGRFTDPLHERTLVGADDVRATNQPAVDDLTDIGIDLFWILGNEERAVAEGRMVATSLTNGTRLDFEFVMVAETQDGHLLRVTEYFDTNPLLP